MKKHIVILCGLVTFLFAAFQIEMYMEKYRLANIKTAYYWPREEHIVSTNFVFILLGIGFFLFVALVYALEYRKHRNEIHH